MRFMPAGGQVPRAGGTVHIASQLAFITLAAYGFQYWLRSERDEDFMLASNEEYQGYRQQVAYKYFPGLI